MIRTLAALWLALFLGSPAAAWRINDYTTCDLLNIGLVQSVAFVDVATPRSEETSNLDGVAPFASIEVEYFRLTRSKDLGYALSLCSESYWTLRQHRAVASRHHALRLNLGFVRQYDSSQGYKDGVRHVSLLLSGGLITDSGWGDLAAELGSPDKRMSAGIQLIFRYTPGGHGGIFEPTYSKFYFNVEKLEPDLFLYRVGLGYSCDVWGLLQNVS